MSEKNKKHKNQNQSQKKDDKQKNQKNPNSQKKNENKSKNNEKALVKPIPVKETKLKNDTRPPISKAPVDLVNEETSSRGKYSKRKVESNWAKLELPDNIYEKTEDSARGANMAELLKKPISIGEHFQFKHEKFWSADSKYPDENDLFLLDMTKIANQISCIPFYERNELDPSLFSSEEMQWMKRTANINSSLDVNPLHISSRPSTVKEDLKSFDVTVTAKESTLVVENNNAEVDELDEILDDSQKPSVPDVVKDEQLVTGICPDAKDDDLEDWLNEYLK